MRMRNALIKFMSLIAVFGLITGCLSSCNISDGKKDAQVMFDLGLTVQKSIDDFNSCLDKKITREEALSVILSITGLVMDNAALLEDSINSILEKYSDFGDISGEYKRSIGICVKKGLIEDNSSQQLKPKANISGKEVKYAIIQALGYDIEGSVDKSFYKYVTLPGDLKGKLNKADITYKDFYGVCRYVLFSKNKADEIIGEKLVYQLAVDEKTAFENGIADGLFVKRLENRISEINAISVDGINEYMYLSRLIDEINSYLSLEIKSDNKALTESIKSIKKQVESKKAALGDFLNEAKEISANNGNLAGISIFDRTKKVSSIKKSAPAATKSDGLVTLENAYSKYVFDIKDRLRLVSFFNKEAGREMLTERSSGSLIKLETGSEVFTEQSFDLIGADAGQTGNRAIFTAKLQTTGPDKLEVTVTVTMTDGPKVDFDIKIKNLSDNEIKVIPTFPNLKGLKISDNIENNWYMYPRRGGVIDNKNISFYKPASALYGLAVTFPIMDIYDNGGSGGLYMLAKGDFSQEKLLLFEKSSVGIDMSIKYYERNIPKGGEWSGATAELGVHPGDWYNAVSAYKEYLNTWFEPAEYIKVLDNVVQIETVYSTMPSVKDKALAGVNPSTKVKGIFEQGKKDFNGYDVLHWFDWWNNLGDYQFNTSYGGIREINKVANEVHDLNKRFSLYTEGILANNYSLIAKETNNGIFRLDKDGNLYVNNNSYDVTCTAYEGWQDHYVNRLLTIAANVPVDNLYLDQLGNHNELACYNPLHNHADIYCGLDGQINLVKRLRDGFDNIRPGISFGGEYPVTDYMSQYLSYVYNYNCSKWYVGLDGMSTEPLIDLYSFIFTNLRHYSIVIYPVEDGVFEDAESLKLVFFNGYGRCNYDNDNQEFIKKHISIIRSFTDVFYSDIKTPLLITDNKDFYVNKFSDSDGNKTIYTLLNKTAGITGSIVLDIENPDSYMYFDLWSNKQLVPTISDGKVMLEINLPSGDVGAVAVIKK